jgi:hypothetical protein
MRKVILFFLLLSINEFISAQSLKSPVAAPYIGLGAYSQKQVDVFSFFANQAALAQLKAPAFGVYSERRFLLAETQLFSAVAVLPTKNGNFGFQADYFGYKNFNESQLGIAYARSAGKNLDLGIKFNYYSFRIPGYQNAAAVNFEIGAIAHLSEKLHAGIDFYNPVGGNISKTDHEKLSAIYKFGIGYDASENFLVSAEIIKVENMPVNVTAGVQYNFAKQFFARAGLTSENGSPYAGAGLCWNNLRLDVCASFHPQLGISPGVLLIINVNEKQSEKD